MVFSAMGTGYRCLADRMAGAQTNPSAIRNRNLRGSEKYSGRFAALPFRRAYDLADSRWRPQPVPVEAPSALGGSAGKDRAAQPAWCVSNQRQGIGAGRADGAHGDKRLWIPEACGCGSLRAETKNHGHRRGSFPLVTGPDLESA